MNITGFFLAYFLGVFVGIFLPAIYKDIKKQK